MNHAGEITPLVAHGAAACRADHDDRAGAHRASRLARGDRRRQGGDLLRARAGRRRRAQSRRAAVRAARAPRRGRAAARVATFGADAACDARLRRGRRRSTAARASARASSGASSISSLGAPGRHMAENALGVLLACRGAGRRRSPARRRRSPDSRRRKGRGERFTLPSAERPVHLIDESYNANPASMRAALALLGAVEPAAAGRRIAVIGDMLELGPDGADMHAALAPGARAQSRRPAVRRRPADARALRRRAGGDARRLGRAVERHSAPNSSTRCAAATSSWSRARTAAAWGRWSRPCANNSLPPKRDVRKPRC